jgi:agmatinase
MPTFDPNAAASPDAGLFGLDHVPEAARVVVLPVPWEATTSYGGGTSRAPQAVLRASHQVDLFDTETGRPYEAGIAMLPEPPGLGERNGEAMAAARKARQGDLPAQAQVNALCADMNRSVQEATHKWLQEGKIVGILGGDHSVSFGAIAAQAARCPGLGILHFDAHADLRQAYEGFEWSHASIMYNVLHRLPNVTRLVQVGIRDLCDEEAARIESMPSRVHTWYDATLARQRFEGTTWSRQVERILADLPHEVYVSFDIDGLDPTLCPHTGTPVPGGLGFQAATYVLAALVESERRLVGFDLVEVAPGGEGEEWDANVGARLLYKLIGWSLRSQAE